MRLDALDGLWWKDRKISNSMSYSTVLAQITEELEPVTLSWEIQGHLLHSAGTQLVLCKAAQG